MHFEAIDLERWERKEYYLHFMNEVVCSYAATVHMDITPLKGQRLYPAMLWLLTKTVNRMPEFRVGLRPEGPGIYDMLHPSYTLFHREGKNFTCVWTAYRENYREFLRAYEEDVATYGNSDRYIAKSGRPENSFDVSMVPWLPFTAFNINVYDDGHYLLPIFTMGKYEDRDGKRLLPLAIQVHHAVCDGYHVGRFVALLQEALFRFGDEAGSD